MRHALFIATCLSPLLTAAQSTPSTRYIVVMKNSKMHVLNKMHTAAAPLEALKALRRRRRRLSSSDTSVAADVTEFHVVLDGFTATLDNEELRLLQGIPAVDKVEKDELVNCSVTVQNPIWAQNFFFRIVDLAEIYRFPALFFEINWKSAGNSPGQ